MHENNFISRHGTALLIVEERVAPDDVLEQMPVDSRLVEVARRGSARIYRATTTGASVASNVIRVGTAPEGAFYGIKR